MTRLLSFSVLALAFLACNNNGGKGPDDGDGDDSGGGGPVEQKDSDGDSILDVHEGSEDPDGDGKGNFEDEDSDGDTIKDKIEAGDEDPLTLPLDSDGDGTPDFLDLDSDNNCIPDKEEKGGDTAVDTDGDGVRDVSDPDNDGDGILDIYEIGAECDPQDTDDDGTPDYLDIDSDGDGIGDKYEANNSSVDPAPGDSDGDGIPDYLDEDSDNDGIPDSEESGGVGPETEPPDTDGDGKYDFQDDDADGDGVTDGDEIDMGLDPYDADTDGDGFTDGAEIQAGTDPLDSEDVIDGVYVEVGERTEVESTFTFSLHVQRGDISLTSDTTCSMSSSIAAAKAVFTQILDDVQDTFEDVSGGAGGFDDYAYGSFGSAPDKPFYVLVPITSDYDAVQDGVDALTIHNGADGPESGMEGSFQSASGRGYDQDCDGNYDSSTDVPPFVSTSSDIFGGSAPEAYDPSLPDSGTRGGFGFRDYSVPFNVLVQDNYMRDPESTNSMYNSSPNGCDDAGHSDVIAAWQDLGGYPIYVDVAYGSGAGLADTQARELADGIGARADMNEDGDIDDDEDLLVTNLDQSSGTYADDLADYVVLAVQQLVSQIKFTQVSLLIEGDSQGFVVGVSPDSYNNIEPDDQELDFTITFRGVVAATTEDQTFVIDLLVLGDGTTLLDQQQIVIVVPGSAY